MRTIALALLMLLSVWSVAAADPYPSRRITVIVPFGAGSGTDSVARIVTQRLAELLKATIVVENRPGASGSIGAIAAARSAPDGYTLFFGGSSTHAANPSLLKSIQYSPLEDFAPIARLGLFPYILVVHPDIKAKSVSELIEFAQQKPGTMHLPLVTRSGGWPVKCSGGGQISTSSPSRTRAVRRRSPTSSPAAFP